MDQATRAMLVDVNFLVGPTNKEIRVAMDKAI
jgi:hypothetical protein